MFKQTYCKKRLLCTFWFFVLNGSRIPVLLFPSFMVFASNGLSFLQHPVAQPTPSLHGYHHGLPNAPTNRQMGNGWYPVPVGAPGMNMHPAVLPANQNVQPQLYGGPPPHGYNTMNNVRILFPCVL